MRFTEQEKIKIDLENERDAYLSEIDALAVRIDSVCPPSALPLFDAWRAAMRAFDESRFEDSSTNLATKNDAATAFNALCDALLADNITHLP